MQDKAKISFPSSKKELKFFGWEQPDIILISGDAYIDHPAFGVAIIARVLEDSGYKVAVIPQPNCKDDLRDFKKLGKPRLFFGVSAGNMDSMVNHYTANKRLRSDDAYTPGGKAGFRPDYASMVYSNILKSLFPDVPVIIGGIEASMRRFTHYDYWQDKLLPTILHSSKADILCYGMAEKSIVEIASNIDKTGHIYEVFDIKQIAYLGDTDDSKSDDIILNSHKDCLKNKNKYAENFIIIEKESNKYNSRQRITQIVDNKKLIVNPHENVLSEKEIDSIYNLPYTGFPHPRYNKKEPVPAYEMIKNSVTIHRGCFGGCSFCTISAHQGKFISSRSKASIINELEKISKRHDFKGHISDIGGPTANMYKMKGINIRLCEKCNKASCIFPDICKNLNCSHKPLTELYKKTTEINGIKKVTVGSGIRYDLCLAETGSKQTDKENSEYVEILIKNHVSGRLKVAPEHTSQKLLQLMRKPSFGIFRKFKKIFDKINSGYNLNQQLVPYFISAHPGCTENDMAELAGETKDLGFKLEQVQAFTPTPMTLSAVMYHTGKCPYTKKPVFVAKTNEERKKQIRHFFWYK